MDSETSVIHRSVSAPRPVHLRKRSIALVAFGGGIGTACREALTLAVPAIDGLPVVTALINLTGAFLLGLLLEFLARRGLDDGPRRTMRLLLGTGALGGFTTYSSLANDTAALLRGGDGSGAIVYALGTVLLGAVATWADIATGTTLQRFVAQRGRR